MSFSCHPKLQPLRGLSYDQSNQIWRSSSNQQTMMLDWLKSVFSSKQLPRTIKILSIGCGSGILEAPFFEHLIKKGYKLEVVGVDPNQSSLDQFRSQMESLEISFKGFNEFFEKLEFSQTFDIILAVHVLYFVRDLADVTRKSLKLLDRGGHMAVLASPENAINQPFKMSFKSLFDFFPHFSESLSQVLKHERMSYRLFPLTAYVNPSHYLQKPSDETSELFLSFMLHHDIRGLPQEEKRAFWQYLRSIAIEDAGEYRINHEVHGFLIPFQESSG